MKSKYRIIEEKVPLMQAYLDESSEIKSDIKYSEPIYSLEYKKHIFSKWKKIDDISTIKEGLFKIHNSKIEKLPYKKRIIKIQ
jgi:hypothetical protein